MLYEAALRLTKLVRIIKNHTCTSLWLVTVLRKPLKPHPLLLSFCCSFFSVKRCDALKMDALKQKGNDAFKLKKYTEAVQFYSQAIELDPNSEASAALYSNRAACWQSLGKFDNAVKDSTDCIRVRPSWLKGHFRKGVALQSLNSLEESLKSFQEAQKVEPENQEVKEKLTEVNNLIRQRDAKMKPSNCKSAADAKVIGNSLFSQGQYERATEFYSRAIELQKEDSEEKANYYANRAACYQQTHLYQLMIEDCNAAIKINPKHVKAYLRRAFAYEGLEKWKLALEDFQKAKQLSPSLSVASQGVLRCQRCL